MKTLPSSGRRRSSAAYAGELFPVEALFADGLLVRSDGAFVRYLEVTPRNPLVMDDSGCAEMAAGFAAVVNRVPAGMSAQIYVEATPLRLADVLLDYQHQVQRATASLAEGDSSHQRRAQALQALAGVQAESLHQHADDHAAVQVRYLVVLPYAPELATRQPGSLGLRPTGRSVPLKRDAIAHQRVARESLRYADSIRGELQSLGLAARPLDGPQVADLLWRRATPTRAHTTRALPPSTRADELLSTLEEHSDPEAAQRAGARLRDAIAQGAIDEVDRRWLDVDGALEQTVYVSSVPEHTFYGWVLHAMQSQKPWTISVHLEALDRHRERQAYRHKARRLRGANTGAMLAGREDDDQLDQEGELRALTQELRNPSASMFRMSIYASVREPGPNPDPTELTEAVDQLVRDVSNAVDVRVQRGEFMQLELWRATLPLALDVANKARPYPTRHVADCLPLVGTSCGSPSGLQLGYADPGRTLERLDPFDPTHDNGTLILNAKSGGGKTFLVLHLLMQSLALGVQAAVVDRSAGHYKFLCSLIPGAKHLEIGGQNDLMINPWDVDDVSAVPGSKISFLVRLHALLIGDHHAAGDSFGLEPLERNLLSMAIRGVYEDAEATGHIPCESYLREQLYQRARDEALAADGSPEIAGIYRTLAERLHDYCGDGAYGYLLDRPTTVSLDDAPLAVFDTKAVPEDVSPAVLFVLSEAITRRIEARREAHLASANAGRSDGGMFDGRFMLVLEELWKQVGRRATGEWLNDLARRARHLGLFLVCVTQQRSDLAGPYGKALLDNSTMQVFLRQSADELTYLADALKLTQAEIEQIGQLKTEKRSYSQAFVINGTRGRGVVSVRLGARAYWIATSDPLADVPIREQALRHADEQPWLALQLLADPDWHRQLNQA